MRKLLKRITTAVATAAIATAMCFSALAADTYHVAGAEGLTGVNWDPAENQMTANGDGTFTKVFENVAKGTYEFKIVTNGAWDNGEYNLEGDASSGGANAEVTVDADGSTVTVTFDGEKASVNVEAGGAAPGGNEDETPAPGSGEDETPAPGPGEDETPAPETPAPETPAPETPAPETTAEKNVTIKVTLDSSIAWEKAFLYAWNGEDNNTWPGVELVKDGDVYSVTIPVTHAKMNMIINNGDGEQTIDIEGIDVTGDAVEITVGAKNADGKYEATTPQAAAAPKTADSTNIALIIAVMAAMGCAVVAVSTKKKANR